ncbi:hypothetical protein IPG41_06540 [Candidatus Peregrinibacteria bacterium]|nr:MAG: hypothetical protein IPG41_06540 [Candidatus Peregrinibacteria bacterium]
MQNEDTLSPVFGDQWQSVAEYSQIQDPNIIHVGDQIKIPEKIITNAS